METSATFSQFRNSHFRKSNRSQLPRYIFNQQSADNQLSTLLDLISQCNSIIQQVQPDRCRQYCKKMAKQLQKIDSQHRSYIKIKSMVLTCTILVLINLQQSNKIKPFLQQVQKIDWQIDNNLYVAKLHLLKILVATFQFKISSKQQQIKRLEIVDYYRQFSKVKFSAQGQYYDFRLWEDNRLVEILIYQYILIVQKLAQLDEARGTLLYKRGVQIAKKVLGKNHKLTEMLVKIRLIRKQTNKLLRSSINNSYRTDNQNSSSKLKSKSLYTRKLNNILNPEQAIRNSKIKTQISHSLTKRYERSTQLPQIQSPYRQQINLFKNSPKNVKDSARQNKQHKMKSLDDNMQVLIAYKVGSQYKPKGNTNKQRKSLVANSYAQVNLQQDNIPIKQPNPLILNNQKQSKVEGIKTQSKKAISNEQKEKEKAKQLDSKQTNQQKSQQIPYDKTIMNKKQRQVEPKRKQKFDENPQKQWSCNLI